MCANYALGSRALSGMRQYDIGITIGRRVLFRNVAIIISKSPRSLNYLTREMRSNFPNGGDKIASGIYCMLVVHGRDGSSPLS